MYKVKIEKLDHCGRGIAKIDGKIVFIPKTLKGDIVEIELVKENKKIIEAKVVNFIEKVPRKSICPYSEICGGCHIIDMDYSEQLNYKKAKIKSKYSTLY